MDGLNVLLLDAFDWYKPLAWTASGFANGFRICRVGLLFFTKGLTNCGAISTTSCPSAWSVRAQ
jgi:hypothetical protein